MQRINTEFAKTYNRIKKRTGHVSDYQWSSDSRYRRNIGDGLVSIDFILDMFARNRRKALVEYARFMEEDSRESMDEILKFISASKEDFKRIKSASRARRLTPLKIRYIEECLKRNYRMEDIGKNIGISQAAVSKMLN
jgi:YesN/AraC family two-component response regulator